MTINNLRKWKMPAGAFVAALLFATFGYGPAVEADHADPHIEAATTGTAVLDGNGGATLETFTPDLDLDSSLAATLTATSSADTTAYYGVHITSATTTGDVFWRITVSHETEALATGDVTITEKGYFDATGGTVEDSAYTASEVSGDLVFEGNSGWEVIAGDDFTNVDGITFDVDAATGVYTVTRVLVDNSTTTETEFDGAFTFTVDLEAAAAVDITPPVFATTTDVMATATTSAGVIVNFDDPEATDDTDTDVEVTCDPSSGTNFAVGTTTVDCTAEDDAGNSATTTFDVIVTLDEDGGGDDGDVDITQPIFENGLFCSTQSAVTISGTAAAGSTVTITGGLSTATATTTAEGTWSTTVNVTSNTSTDIEVTVTDSGGDEVASDSLTIISDNIAPTITLNGEANMTISEQDDPEFNDPGVTVSDNLDATTTVMTSGQVVATDPGNYTVTYTATDCAGNSATTTRNVTVELSGGGGGGGGSRNDDDDDDDNDNDDDDRAEAFVIAGIIIDGGTTIIPGLPGIPNTGTVLGITFAVFTRDLRIGMSGPDVVELQTKLFGAGLFRGPITGFYGPLTADAVRRLQAGLNLPVNGILDLNTRNVLNNS